MPPQMDPRVKELNDQSTTWLIVALVGFWLGFGFITGPLCWIKAGRIRDNYRQMGMAPSGAATGAWVIGIVTSILLIMGIMAVVAVFALFSAAVAGM